MRIDDLERKIITDAIYRVDPDARIYLFGSRAKDDAKGGDIDILVISERIDYEKKLAIRSDFFNKLEDQKIDLVIKKNTDDAFVRSVLPDAVTL